MESLKLPTDNLYKFVALSGLVIAVTALYFGETFRQSTVREIDSLDSEIAGVLAEYHILYGSEEHELLAMPGQPPAPELESENIGHYLNAKTSEQRSNWRKHLRVHGLVLRYMSAFPKASEKESQACWKAVLGLSDVQYTELAKTANNENSLVGKTTALARSLRPRHERMRVTLDRLWGLIDDLEDVRDFAYDGCIAGLVIAVAGFIAWYFLVQIYEDRILRRKSAEVTKVA